MGLQQLLLNVIRRAAVDGTQGICRCQLIPMSVMIVIGKKQPKNIVSIMMQVIVSFN